MKSFLRVIASVALVLSTLAIAAPSSAAPKQPIRFYEHGYAVATAGSTFATTSYADLAGATVVVPAAKRTVASVNEAPGTPANYDRLEIQWSLDAIKATATTGTCAIFVNGAVVAATSRTVDFAAKNTTLGGFYEVARSTDAAQTVKLQCKSGDTNVFTVNFGNLRVREILGS